MTAVERLMLFLACTWFDDVDVVVIAVVRMLVIMPDVLEGASLSSQQV